MQQRSNERNRGKVGYSFAVGITIFFLALELLHRLKLPPKLELLSNLNIAGNPLILLFLLVVLLLFPGLKKVKLLGLFELEKNVKEIGERTAEIQRTINTFIQSLSVIAGAKASITQIIGLRKENLDILASLARIRSAEELSEKTMKASHKSSKTR